MKVANQCIYHDNQPTIKKYVLYQQSGSMYLVKSCIVYKNNISYCFSSYTNTGPAHERLVLIVYAQQPPLRVYTDVSGRPRDLKFGWSLHLRLYFVYVRIGCSDETARMRSLV